MNTATKLVFGSFLVAVMVGAGLARLRLDDPQAAWDGTRRLLLSTRVPSAPPSSPPAAASPPSAAYGSASIPRNGMGQFETSVDIDGQSVPMMVDTGATLVVLSFEDANRLGIRPAPSEFDQWVNTANGRAAVAPVTLRQIRLGSIVERDVAALVAQRRALGSSLLGMTFLGRLRSVRVEDGRLALQQ